MNFDTRLVFLPHDAARCANAARAPGRCDQIQTPRSGGSHETQALPPQDPDASESESRSSAAILKLLVPVFALLLFSAAPASAAPTHACGSTAKDAIAAAEKAMAEGSAGAQSVAIRCLITALKTLEASQPIIKRAHGERPILHVPVVPAKKPEKP